MLHYVILCCVHLWRLLFVPVEDQRHEETGWRRERERPGVRTEGRLSQNPRQDPSGPVRDNTREKDLQKPGVVTP